MNFLKNKRKQIYNVNQDPIPSIYEPDKSEKEKDNPEHWSTNDVSMSKNDVMTSKPDVLTSIIGEFGRFQLFNLFLMGVSTIMVGTNNFVTKFLAHEVDYWCTKVKHFFQQLKFVVYFDEMVLWIVCSRSRNPLEFFVYPCDQGSIS